jgi:hypothetical protein
VGIEGGRTFAIETRRKECGTFFQG